MMCASFSRSQLSQCSQYITQITDAYSGLVNLFPTSPVVQVEKKISLPGTVFWLPKPFTTCAKTLKPDDQAIFLPSSRAAQHRLPGLGEPPRLQDPAGAAAWHLRLGGGDEGQVRPAAEDPASESGGLHHAAHRDAADRPVPRQHGRGEAGGARCELCSSLHVILSLPGLFIA